MTKAVSVGAEKSSNRARATKTQSTAVASGPTQQTMDLSEAADGMRPADRKLLYQIATEYNERPQPVTAKLEKTDGKWAVSHEGTLAEQMANRIRLHAAFGSFSQPFMDTIVSELLTIWDSNNNLSERTYNAALAVLQAAAPQNEMEAMLVVQMIAANEAGLRATSMVGKADTLHGALGFGNLANKYMRTFVAQTEALAKLRRGGEQIVKYIHVHEGGQAVVAGTINQQGGRVNAGTAERPYEQAPDAPVAALPGQDPTRDSMSVSRHAEWEMSHPRRQEPRAAEGE